MYNEIAANKRKTVVLIGLVTAFIVVLFGVLGVMTDTDPSAMIVIGTVVATIYSLISYYWSARLTLFTHGAHELKKSESPELWNLLENLAIAKGLPMPKLYVMDDPSPNAFATGRDPQHASVTVTTGLLQLLGKQELEGVLAHELSHVSNYDIRVMTIVVVLVGLISLIADLLIHLRPRKSEGQAALVLMIVGIVLAILSPFIAQLIKLAVSRTREYLADASGALLTRYPDGLASALEKIESASAVRPLMTANHATAHLFISNPFGKAGFAAFLSTHPPTNERVKRLRSMGV